VALLVVPHRPRLDHKVGLVLCFTSDFKDLGVENRSPRVGVVLDKIEWQEERDPLTSVLTEFFYAKDKEVLLRNNPRWFFYKSSRVDLEAFVSRLV
jgi:hypothetical protein